MEPEERVTDRDPPTFVASMPSKGHRSSRPSSRKRGDSPRSMFDLCRCKLLPFTAIQIADLPDPILGVSLQLRWEDLHEEHKVWSDGVASEQYYHGSLCPVVVK